MASEQPMYTLPNGEHTILAEFNKGDIEYKVIKTLVEKTYHVYSVQSIVPNNEPVITQQSVVDPDPIIRWFGFVAHRK